MKNRIYAALLILVLPLIMLGIHFRVFHVYRPKHMGAVTYFGAVTHSCMWFGRKNGEVFVTCFDNPPEFKVGLELTDLVYVDDSRDMVHFISAAMPVGKR